MKSTISRFLSLCVSLLMLFAAPSGRATCGGGGGGGGGGMSEADAQAYQVPWTVVKASDPAVKDGLVLYWFPSSEIELQKSSLRTSRDLTLYAGQCVAMKVADTRSDPGTRFAADARLPVAVLVSAPDGSVVGKMENKNGMLHVEDIEKMVQSELKRREETLDQQLKDARSKAKEGAKDAAIAQFRAVLEQKCLFPKKAKDAAKELKKLGVEASRISDPPNFDPRVTAQMVRAMDRGVAAEFRAQYREAERLYSAAHQLDPNDPVPLRFLGELYRHQTGEWDKARQSFHEILAMPADPLTRSVALHGLGKMTIHDGEFDKGRDLMEQAIAVYPLALAYRNLAVYWNSEGDAPKTDAYVRLALNADPKDPYNLVFAAVFLAANGHTEEALKVARENESLLPASYNLAAIYAQAGQREKALALLKRHFFAYERYQAVRSQEMMEARVDAVFLSLRTDPAFVSLTSGADGKLNPAKPMDTRSRAEN